MIGNIGHFKNFVHITYYSQHPYETETIIAVLQMQN